MCGLYGAYSNYLADGEKDDVHELALTNITRGKDSSGIMVGHREGGKNKIQPHIVLSNAANLWDSGQVKETLRKGNTFFIAGHNRFATVGDINAKNAHPITEGSVTGTHNGTIGSLETEAKKEGINDSRLLMRMISQLGIQGAINELEIGDAWALVFANTKDNTFNIVRNGLRPLFIMFASSRSTFFWSSERRALEFMARGRGTNNFKEPFELDTYEMLQVELGTMKMKEVPLEIKPQRSIFPHNKWAPWDSYGSAITDAEWEEFEKKVNESTQRPTDDGHVIRPEEVQNLKLVNPKDAKCYVGFQEIPMALNMARKYLRSGCVCCGNPKEITDGVYWLDHDEFVCADDCWEDSLFQATYGHKDMWEGKLQ